MKINRYNFVRSLYKLVLDSNYDDFTFKTCLSQLRGFLERDINRRPLSWFGNVIGAKINKALTSKDFVKRHDGLFEYKNTFGTDDKVKQEVIKTPVRRFTKADLTTTAQKELQSRLNGITDLIVLQRDNAVGREMARFSSWRIAETEYIPNYDVMLKDVKEQDYIERRCANDQAHKVIAAIDDIIATENDALAMTWQQNYTNNPRHDHAKINGKTFVIKNSWPVKEGLIKADSYLEDLKIEHGKDKGQPDMPARQVNCVCSGIYIYSITRLYKMMPEVFTKKGIELMTKK